MKNLLNLLALNQFSKSLFCETRPVFVTSGPDGGPTKPPEPTKPAEAPKAPDPKAGDKPADATGDKRAEYQDKAFGDKNADPSKPDSWTKDGPGIIGGWNRIAKGEYTSEFKAKVGKYLTEAQKTYKDTLEKATAADQAKFAEALKALQAKQTEVEALAKLDAAKQAVAAKQAEFTGAKLADGVKTYATDAVKALPDTFKATALAAVTLAMKGAEESVTSALKAQETALKGEKADLATIQKALDAIPADMATLLAKPDALATQKIETTKSYLTGVGIIADKEQRFPFMKGIAEGDVKVPKTVLDNFNKKFDEYAKDPTKMPKADALLTEIKEAQTKVLLYQVLGKMTPEQMKKLKEALKVKEVTPDSLKNFLEKYGSFKFDSAGSAARQSAINVLEEALKDQGLQEKVVIDIQGGADAEEIALLEKREPKYEELRKIAQRIIKDGGDLAAMKTIPQVANQIKEITAYAGSTGKCLKFMNDHPDTEWGEAGGVLNTLLFCARSVNMGGDAIFANKNIRVGGQAALTGSADQSKRFGKVSFCAPGLAGPATVPTDPTAKPEPVPGPKPEDPKPGVVEAPVEKLAKAKEALKTRIPEIDTLIGTVDPLITTCTEQGQAVTDAKAAVLAAKQALTLLITGKTPAFIDAMPQADLDTFKTNLEAAVTTLKTAIDNLNKANLEAKTARERQTALGEIVKDVTYTDSYGKKFSFDGTNYFYDSTKLVAGKPLPDAKDTLNILTGRKFLTENNAKFIAEKELPGVNVTNKKYEIKYDQATTTATISITDDTQSPAATIDLKCNLKTGEVKAGTNHDITKLLEPIGTDAKAIAILKGKGFDITVLPTALSTLTEPQKSITDWISAGNFAKALRGDGTVPNKGLVDPGTHKLNPLITDQTVALEQFVVCFKNDATATGGALAIDTDLVKSILPRLDIDANYARISTYITDVKDRLRTLINPAAKLSVKFATIKTDIDSIKTTDQALFGEVLVAVDANKEWQTALAADAALRIEAAKYFLVKGPKLPTYLLEKLTLADVAVLITAGPTLATTLTDQVVKDKIGALIAEAVDNKANLPGQTVFATIIEKVWGPNWDSAAPAKVVAAHDSLDAASTAINLAPRWTQLNGAAGRAEYLTTLFKNPDYAAAWIDIRYLIGAPAVPGSPGIPAVPAIPANPVVLQDVLTTLLPLKNSSKQASELYLTLLGNKNFTTPLTATEQTENDSRIAALKADYAKLKVPTTSANAEEKYAIAKALDASAGLAATDKAAISTTSEPDFTKTVLTAKAESAYQLAVEGKNSVTFADVDFTGTSTPATDERVIFMAALDNAGATVPPKAFMDALKAGKYATPQLEALMREAAPLAVPATMKEYVQLAIAANLLGVAKAQIETSFSAEPALKLMWLSRLEATGSPQQKDLLTKAYLAIASLSPAEQSAIDTARAQITAAKAAVTAATIATLPAALTGLATAKLALATANNAVAIPDAKALQVIEACMEAGVHEIILAGGAKIEIDETPGAPLVRMAEGLSVATSRSGGYVNALKATELLFQFEGKACQAGGVTCEKGELVTELRDAYLSNPAARLAPEQYASLEKSIIGPKTADNYGIAATDLSTDTRDATGAITVRAAEKQQAYATMLFALATRTPPVAETPAHVAAFTALDPTWIPAGPVKAQYDALKSAPVLSGAVPAATATQAQKDLYIDAVLASASSTDANLKDAAKLVSAKPKLDLLIAKAGANDSLKAEIYIAASTNNMAPADTITPAIALANSTAGITPVIFDSLVQQSMTKAPGNNPDLVKLTADAKYCNDVRANFAADKLIDKDVSPLPAELKDVWTGFVAKAPGALKNVARHLVDNATPNRANALKALDGVPATPTVTTIRTAILTAYAAANAVETGIAKGILGL